MAVVAVLAILVVGVLAASSLGMGSSRTSSANSSSGLSATSSTALTTVSSLGGGVFNAPGNLLITDQYNNRVVEVDPQTNQIVWSFGSGNGTLCNPGSGAVIGPNDAERLAGGLTLIAGTGLPAGAVSANQCQDNRVMIVNQAGNITWQYGQAGVNGSGPDQLNVPVFAIQLPNGDVMIVDQGNNRVIEVNSTEQVVWSYGPATGPGELNGPNSAELLTNGDVLIADQGNNRVIEVDHTGDIVWQYDQGLDVAAFASRLPNNDTLMVDSGHSRIFEVAANDSIVWQYFTNDSQDSNPSPTPSNAVRLANGDTCIADQINDRIVMVNNSNQTVYQYGMTNVPGVGADQLNWPYTCSVIGDYTGQTIPQGMSSISASSVGVAEVSIPSGTSADQGLDFSPKTVTIVIGVNNTVVWTNDDVAIHTVTSLGVPAGAAPFNGPGLNPGSNFSVTFTVPGAYEYHCSIHAWMSGTIVVKS
jgi:plastocyanin